MPVTPLHFGPAIAGKAFAPKHFSVLAFGLTQVIIDAEAGFYLMQGSWPVHRFLHSYLGATVVAVVTALLGRPLLGLVIRGWNRLLAGRFRDGPQLRPDVPLAAVISGAVLGSYSHVFLDSIVHADMTPFAPWHGGNPLLHAMPAANVTLLCVGMGLTGGLVLLLAAVRRRRRSGNVGL